MTLREEVLKNAGLLTEEILEEGKFGRAVAVALMIAALAFGGVKGAQTVKNYKAATSVSASTKYDYADYKSSTSQSLLKISTDYSRESKQSILNLSVYADYGLRNAEDYTSGDLNELHKIIDRDYLPVVTSSLKSYVENLEAQNSKLEKVLNKSTYADVKPIRINIDIVYNKQFNNYKETSTFLTLLSYDLKEEVAKFFGIDERLVDVLINGKRAY